MSEGLWQYARHPNYASWQANWIIFYLFGITASGKLVSWTFAGTLFPNFSAIYQFKPMLSFFLNDYRLFVMYKIYVMFIAGNRTYVSHFSSPVFFIN